MGRQHIREAASLCTNTTRHGLKKLTTIGCLPGFLSKNGIPGLFSLIVRA